jgi:CHAD domain-containing protein
MADTKWIPGLKPDMPVRDAAQRVLAVRIGHVLERLPAAVERPEEDVEHVHQLRVNTRRAGAAVRIFAESLPAGLHRRLRKSLKTVRRAAGAARDWDVFLETIVARQRRRTSNHQAGLDFLSGFGHGHRAQAQEHLLEATAGQGDKLKRCLDELSEVVHDGTQTLRDLAIPMLTTLQQEFERAARGDLQAYEALHQVRIKGKQLRYAMELFETCFHAAFRLRVYPSIADMQEILGNANDSHVATLMLDQLRSHLERTQPAAWKRYRPVLEALALYHRRRLPKQRKLFETWWDKWQTTGLSAALVKWLQAG